MLACAGQSALATVGTKRALLVGVGSYDAGTGWTPTAARRDIALLSRILQQHGFEAENISVLEDEDATRKGILDAFDEQLVAKANIKDVVLFHYSGHGHRITDQGSDEPDGYDEVLVAYDAPRRPPAGYAGEKHVRDDELGTRIEAARAAVGPEGEVIVFIDSCFSGTGTRGVATARGDTEPIGPAARTGSDAGSSLLELAPAGDGLGRLVVFSASRHNQLAFETRDAEGAKVGSLSWALVNALAESGPDTSYHGLFHDVRLRMAGLVVNRPQAEGDLGGRLFGGGAVAQSSFHRVKRIDPGSGAIVLEGGVLLGLVPGTVVGFYPPDTRAPTAAPAAQGSIVAADAFEAEVRLEGEQPPPDELAGSWVFVRKRSFGALRVGVVVEQRDSSDAAWGDPLRQALRQEPLTELGDDRSELVVRRLSNGLVLETLGDGRVLLEGLPPGAASQASILARCRDYARSQYLRQLSFSHPDYAAQVELIPCRMECRPALGGREVCECAERLDPASKRQPDGESVWAVGDGFLLRVSNTGTREAWISVIDLMPDGAIGLLWPGRNRSFTEARLAAGQHFDTQLNYRMGPAEGREVLKVFATSSPVDFRSITSPPPGGNRAGASPFEALLGDASRGARAAPVFPPEKLSTWDFPLTVVGATP